MRNRAGTSGRRELTPEERELLADLYNFIVHNEEEECLAELKEEKYKTLLNVDITAWSCVCDSWKKYERVSRFRDNDTVDAVECMIRTGYCPHAGLPKEKTQLMSFQIIHLAAINGMTCVLEYLLTSCKVKVNCLTGRSKQSPVVYAAFNGNETTALYLLDMGGANHPNRYIYLKYLLIYAIIGRCDRVVKSLLRDKTCDVNVTENEGRTALIKVVRYRPVSQDTKDLVTLLIEAGCDVNIKDCLGWTALFYAIEHKDVGMVEILLKAGASVNVEDNKGISPLTLAIEQRRELTLEERELLADLYHFIVHNDEEGCLAELKEEKYKTLLNVNITARSCGCDSWKKYEGLGSFRDNDTVDAVECMIRTGYCPHAGLPEEKTQLMSFQIIHLAAINGMTCVLEYLVTSCKVNINCLTGRLKLTPVCYAVFYGNETTALYLLDVGGTNHPNLLMNAIINRCDRVVKTLLRDKTCDVNATNKAGRTPLVVAVRDRPVSQDTKELVTLLIEAGGDVNIKDHIGRTALFYAITHKDFGMVEILLKAGSSVNVEDNKGLCPLIVAMFESTCEITKLILEAGADPNSRYKGRPALTLASENGAGYTVCLLLEHKADVNATYLADRQSALHAAAWFGHKTCVNYLLEAGASHDQRTRDGNTPMSMAAHEGHLDIIDMLLPLGCDVTNALHIAAGGGYKACVKYLLEAGASHDQRSRSGNTPMSVAAQRGHTDIIDMLLPLGCDVTNADKDLDTPLHYAAFNGCLKTVTVLVAAGASVNARNTCDATPLWNAVHKGHTNVVRYLVRKNAELNVPSRGFDYLSTSENPTYFYDEPKTPLATVFDSTWTGDDTLIELLLMAGYDIWHEKGLIELTTTPISSSPDVQTVFQTIISHVFSPPSLFHLCKMSLRNTHKLTLEEFMRKQKIPKTITNNIILEGIEKCSQKIPVDSFGKIF